MVWFAAKWRKVACTGSYSSFLGIWNVPSHLFYSVSPSVHLSGGSLQFGRLSHFHRAQHLLRTNLTSDEGLGKEEDYCDNLEFSSRSVWSAPQCCWCFVICLVLHPHALCINEGFTRWTSNLRAELWGGRIDCWVSPATPSRFLSVRRCLPFVRS